MTAHEGQSNSGYTEADCTHLIILRACDADTEGAHAQAKIGHVGEPSEDTIRAYRENVVAMFRAGFGRDPDRIGVAVLPWVAEEDGKPSDEDEL